MKKVHLFLRLFHLDCKIPEANIALSRENDISEFGRWPNSTSMRDVRECGCRNEGMEE